MVQYAMYLLVVTKTTIFGRDCIIPFVMFIHDWENFGICVETPWNMLRELTLKVAVQCLVYLGVQCLVYLLVLTKLTIAVI